MYIYLYNSNIKNQLLEDVLITEGIISMDINNLTNEYKNKLIDKSILPIQDHIFIIYFNNKVRTYQSNYDNFIKIKNKINKLLS